jgi:hypothetical protein
LLIQNRINPQSQDQTKWEYVYYVKKVKFHKQEKKWKMIIY